MRKSDIGRAKAPTCSMCGKPFYACTCDTHCTRCGHPLNKCTCEQSLRPERGWPHALDPARHQPDEDVEAELKRAYGPEVETTNQYWHGWNVARCVSKYARIRCPYKKGTKEARDFWRGVSDYRHRRG